MRIRNKELRQRRHRKEQTIKAAVREAKKASEGKPKSERASRPKAAKAPATKKAPTKPKTEKPTKTEAPGGEPSADAPASE